MTLNTPEANEPLLTCADMPESHEFEYVPVRTYASRKHVGIVRLPKPMCPTYIIWTGRVFVRMPEPGGDGFVYEEAATARFVRPGEMWTGDVADMPEPKPPAHPSGAIPPCAAPHCECAYECELRAVSERIQTLYAAPPTTPAPEPYPVPLPKL